MDKRVDGAAMTTRMRVAYGVIAAGGLSQLAASWQNGSRAWVLWLTGAIGTVAGLLLYSGERSRQIREYWAERERKAT